jgi:hypothetical protein
MAKQKFSVGDIFPASEAENAMRSSLTSHRGLRQYRNLLRLTDEDLREKTILDIGSGIRMKFAREMKCAFPDSRVISLDYAFAEDSERRYE